LSLSQWRTPPWVRSSYARTLPGSPAAQGQASLWSPNQASRQSPLHCIHCLSIQVPPLLW
jgi:hypothetical protein